jgi:ketosteroid isomerase-like protein
VQPTVSWSCAVRLDEGRGVLVDLPKHLVPAHKRYWWAMSQENVDTIQRALASSNPGAVLAILDENVEWDYVGAFPEAVTYHGPAEVGEFLREWAGGFDEFGFEADETIDAGDCVIACLHQWGRGKETGDGKVTRCRGYATKDEALAAAGLAE